MHPLSAGSGRRLKRYRRMPLARSRSLRFSPGIQLPPSAQAMRGRGRWVDMRRIAGKPACLAAGLLVVAMLCGCGGDDATSADQPAEQVRVVEKDFKISAPRTLPAGEVDLSVLNRGPVSHELIVVRGSWRGLPIRSDGITVDGDAIEPDTAAALEPAPAGTHDLDAELQPGHYVLLCNMSGHFKGGMHLDVDVR